MEVSSTICITGACLGLLFSSCEIFFSFLIFTTVYFFSDYQGTYLSLNFYCLISSAGLGFVTLSFAKSGFHVDVMQVKGKTKG